jgi:hypothetical protein
MSTPRLSTAVTRRTAITGLGAGGLGIALAIPSFHAAAQDATPTMMANHPFIGTWIVDRNADDPTDVPRTVIFTADGAVIDPVGAAAGTWRSTGPRTAAWTLVGLNAGGAEGYFVVRTTGEVNEAGTHYSASAAVTIVAPDGTVVATPPALAPQGIRLEVEGLDAAGTPLAGFPKWTPAPPEGTPAS